MNGTDLSTVPMPSPEPEFTRAEVATDTSHLEPGEDEVLEGVYGDGSVRVEVRLVLPDSLHPVDPHPLQGSEVSIQSWVEETDVTTAHSELLGADGVAR
ncbi:MAG: hypothetical protein ACI9F9_002947, partial [Candidatus Paceibacteria bacterium]